MPTLTVDGYPIAYAESGTGKPVVMIHGTLGDQRSWTAQMTPFGERFHAMAVSLRHCWPGQWEDGGDFTIARHTADIAGFIKGLGAGKVRLIGHSRGGHIAFRVAQHHPELLSALVLVEPGGELDESLSGAPPAGKQGAAFAKAAALIGEGKVEEGLTVVAEHTGGPGAWEKRSEARKAVNRANARTLLGQINEQRKPYARAEAQGIATPTLLIGGAQSQPQFGRILDALEPTMPNATRVTIARAAHSVQADNPADFNAAVLAFLERH
ncbi:alpha/beta fold hydrolase [Neoroseomonas oryzicola]|uniref:Alpha/beta hydrolase n=1 Tax=Neoroseomonas oryzicola TaxID=535904 RepID=A0A9X9WN99_9PROT|nr:alpha/beta hydrolase [Neoroseomonas oryzicola]MBR0661809.1 alpha/beta hydrolase [Neoroseomonas oryzicola]NKE17083.1 alpha/beta hydrolase [Neoroseomonas oryzicola]